MGGAMEGPVTERLIRGGRDMITPTLKSTRGSTGAGMGGGVGIQRTLDGASTIKIPDPKVLILFVRGPLVMATL